MKKLISLALAALMILTISLACAATVEPDTDIDDFAGKTLHATVGEYNAEKKTFTVTVYDYDRYDDEDIVKLAAGDTILAGGVLYTIDKVAEEEGTKIFYCGDEEICFEKAPDDDDDLIARSRAYDDRIFMSVVTVLQLPAAEGIVYEDNSNPDLDAQMKVAEGLDAVLAAKAEKEANSIGFDFYATTVTLNAKLEIVTIHQNYDVAQ